MIAAISTNIKEYLSTFSFPDHPSIPVSFETLYDNGKDHLFDFKFPWYNTLSTPEELETLENFKRMFILEYYMSQIKAETMGLFKIRLNALLTKEMPTLTELYKTAIIEYDPLINRKYLDSDVIKTNSKTEAIGNSYNKQNTEGENTIHQDINDQSITSDNPQTNFAGNDYASSMNRGERISDGKGTNKDTVLNNGNTENNSNTSGSSDRKFRTEGFVGSSQTDNLIKYREAIVNINKGLVEECKVLFSWYKGHDYTKQLGEDYPPYLGAWGWW